MSPAYSVYLRSPEWAERREAKFQQAGRRCQECGESERLEVHHLTYDRLGNERLEDLQVLCHWCHCREHDRAPRVGPIAGLSIHDLTDRARSRDLLHRHQLVTLACAEAYAALDGMLQLAGDRETCRDIGFLRRRVRKIERLQAA